MTSQPPQTYAPSEDIAVKICGIEQSADYDTCRNAGAAFVGMVFFPRSPRQYND